MSFSVTQYNCQEAYRRIDDYLDKELPAEEIQLVAEHLEFCLMCASEFKYEATLIEAVRKKFNLISEPSGLFAKISRSLTESNAS